MQAFKIHQSVVEDYKNYLNSFTFIKDERIRKKVDEAFKGNFLLPDALIQFNPSYKTDLTLDELERDIVIQADLNKIFGNYKLYHHQVEAIRKGVNGESFVVTSGTGSGKSLTFLATIFNSILKEGPSSGVKAFLVYPMNALINSQEEEIKKYEINYLKSFLSPGEKVDEVDKSLDEIIKSLKTMTGKSFPVTYAKYSGQDDQDARKKIEEDKPNIILTNYMMLELIMTRNTERWLRDSIEHDLQYLVFDELHTYRGRQGSDVAMLIRRIKNYCKNELICIGTSATMSSEGSLLVRKQAVAEVAGQIFNSKFTVDQIINETLDCCTNYNGKIPSSFDLQEAINGKLDPSWGSGEFIQNRLAIWLENRIALFRHEDGSLERGEPLTLDQITTLMAKDSNEKQETCKKAILSLLQWSEQLNLEGGKKNPRQTFLPFKIHQFISQTGNVYVTLEAKDKRDITLETGRYVKVKGKEKPVFPVLFSRYTGYDFICVRKDFENNLLIPRNPDDLPVRITKEELKGDRKEGIAKKLLKDTDFPDGYIILDDGENIWTQEDEEFLPDTWYKTTSAGEKIDNYYEFRIPTRMSFDAEGNFSKEGIYPLNGWFIPARLLFDPTSGIIYDHKTNENTKLMRLGNEGRSTATTITSFSILKSLSDENVSSQYQKILSFTDNRQDASLQAGHFNDFLMLGRLRSSIYHALRTSPDNYLTLDTISDRVYLILNLKEEEYARNPSKDPDWPDPENEKAIKDYLLLRILYDLKRGWRYNTPNLEQCGLLDITYNRIDEFCERDKFFEELSPFDVMDTKSRKDIIIQILNFFRTSYAFEHYKLLDKRAETEERLKLKLDDEKLWSLDTDEKIDAPYILVTKPVGDSRDRTYTASIGPKSYLGKYLKKLFENHDMNGQKEDEMIQYIEKLCTILERGNFLKSEKVTGKKGKETIGFRLRIDQVIWKLGSGEDVLPDNVRVASFRNIKSLPNDFFKKFYQQDFNKNKQVFEGREHTGQLNSADRIDREDKFRQGKISALFCSPTMELGIDIAELSVVHMRNVPPSPSNYAQRGGRAGRSGQAALIFTYCSNGSPHDRNYFKDSKKMVAGAVVPAKMDLTNEELLLTHFNAYILMELGLKDLHVSVPEILDCKDYPNIPIQNDILGHINDHVVRYSEEWVKNYRSIIESIPTVRESFWYSNDWLTTYANSFTTRFDKSFERWRILFRSARRLIDNARLVMDDPTIGSDNYRKNEAKREHAIGMRQRELLLNNDRKSYGNESEFYVYRYLASEGFLPGYNFTRLPVRAFLGFRHIDKGQFISRSRFVALKEFGPNNVIYNNGGKFRITRMQIAQADAANHIIKIAVNTGYAFLDEEGKGVNNDPITHEELKGQDAVVNFNNLLELSESDAKPQERISCEEEERMSTGFEIDQYFSFPKGIISTRQITIKEADQPLLQVIYNQSAKLIQVNKKWKASRNDEGFLIGKASGKWKRAKELETPNPDDPSMNVRIFTTGTADVLYIQPIKELKLDESGVVSLSFAIKRAIEKQFQVEEGEIGVWIMGKGEHKNILLFESAEGSLGVLSQLIENSNTLHNLFTEAYKVLHFDPETRTDTEPDMPKATYDDLLSYYNQRFHDKLDRYSIKEALERLMDCKIDNQPGEKSVEEQYKYLMENYDLNSSTEKKLIEHLYKNGHRLPDKAQVNVQGCFVNADFVYKTPHGYSLIFCDGSVHDDPDVKADDLKKRQACRDTGYDVIEWHYLEPIEKLVERRKDIFRKIR